MIAKTYEEWLVIGYKVMRGERSTGRNSRGKATFTSAQVKCDIPINDDYEYEDDWMFRDPDLGDR